MKSLLIIFAAFIVLAPACKKQQSVQTLQGNYTGIFTRSLANQHLDTSHVTMNLTSTTFSGTSDKVKYPAICSGTISSNGNTLSAANSCVFTAEFDWSLIFSGDYSYSLNGKQLRIWKNYNEGQVDLYILEKDK